MRKKRGSAILIVVILSLAFTTYVNGTLVSRNNLSIMKSKYESILQDYYTEDNNNLNDLYKELERINK